MPDNLVSPVMVVLHQHGFEQSFPQVLAAQSEIREELHGPSMWAGGQFSLVIYN